MSLQIEFYSTAENKNDFILEFIDFPKKLYADNNKVKKLPFELEALYFKLHHLTHDFFLIKESGVVVLRSMICLTPFPDLAYFGLLDFDYKNFKIKSILSEFKKIINSWCQSQGASKIYGPINFSTWLPYRLLSSVDGGPMFSFEPDRPIEYCQLLKEAGFSTNQLFSSKGYEELDNIINLSKSDYEKALGLGFTFEFFPKELNLEDMKDLHRLSLNIFDDNYLATPIDFETFRTLYAAQSKKDDFTFSLFIKSSTGERIGYFINFVEHDYCVVKTIGIDRNYRGSGLSNGSMYLSLKKAADMGIHKMVAAMVKEGAQSESYGRKMKHLWTHLYEILELPIA
ncbi:MAG: hypothetical protein PHY93_01200 [Bacteriovorax sp.]|nr:hypothetical protein [Bacteriovorax sp.]